MAAALVAAGHGLVLQKRVGGPTPYLALDEGGDAAEYKAMIEGDLATARSPFRYRVLVPLLAKALPLPAFDGLRVLSYVSLFAIYFLLFFIGMSAGLSPPATLAGILVLFLSPAHLYTYYNPYLADAPQLALLCAMVLALLRNSFPLFAISALLGVLTRETTIFLIPAWLFRDRRQALVVLVLAVGALAVPRLLLPHDPTVTFDAAFTAYGLPRLAAPGTWLLQIVWCWQVAWATTLAGICLLRGERQPLLVFAFLLLFAGAVSASLLATDIGRMFAILTPIVAVGTADLVAVLLATRRTLWIAALVPVVVAQALTGIPNAVFGEELRHGWEPVKRAILALGGLYGLGLIVALRQEIVGSAALWLPIPGPPRPPDRPR